MLADGAVDRNERWVECAGALLSLGWMGTQILLLAVRGPHCGRYTWFGYEGGANIRSKDVMKLGDGESVVVPSPSPSPSPSVISDTDGTKSVSVSVEVAPMGEISPAEEKLEQVKVETLLCLRDDERERMLRARSSAYCTLTIT
jgi:hypothetical protein